MKLKKIALILFTLGVALKVGSQESIATNFDNKKYKLSFGIKGGLNVSEQSITYNTNDIAFTLTPINTSSFHFGFYVDFKITNNIGLLSEFLYSEEGSLVNLQIIAFKQKLNYLKVPVLAYYQLFNDRFNIHLGPQFGYVINEKIEFESDVVDEFISSDFKPFEISMATGVEYYITKRVRIGARYNLGLTNISNNNEAKFKNRNFQFYLGVNLL